MKLITSLLAIPFLFFSSVTHLEAQSSLVVNQEMNLSEDDLIRILIQYGNNPDGIPALHYAIKQNNFNVVRLLLDNGASPNAKASSCEYMTPIKALDYAAMYANPDIIYLLVERGAVIRLTEEEKTQGIISPLGFAVISNHHRAMEALFIKGAEISYEHPYPYDCTPLYLAVQYGDVESIKFLLSHGASINDPIYENSPLINIAAESGKSEIVEYLIKHGADLEKNTWIYAAKSGDYELFKEFLRVGLDVNALDSEGNTPLMHAISSGNLDFVKFLVSSGADVNANDSQGSTTLIRTINTGHLDLVKFLVDSGADVNMVCPYKNPGYRESWCPITAALHFPLILEFLINAEADVNIKLDQRKTPLHYAVGTYEALCILLKNGADINAIDLNGNTPLHLAIRNTKAAITLLENGANIHTLNYENWKPSHLAYGEEIELLKEFIKRGTSLNEFNPNGYNALHWACSGSAFGNVTSKLKMIRFLVEEVGMNINENHRWGGGMDGAPTAFMCAIESQPMLEENFTILEYLLKNGADLNAKVFHVYSNRVDVIYNSVLSWARGTNQPRYIIEWLIEKGAR